MINSSTDHSSLLNMVRWLTPQTDSENIGFVYKEKNIWEERAVYIEKQ